MVDKSIGELVAASQINDNDLFVLEQNGEAKKLLGNVLKQNIGSGSNRNLLDNPWFTVNQRGQTSYTGGVYTVDRWQLYSTGDSLIVNNDGTVTLNMVAGSTFRHIFENGILKNNEVYTVSIMGDDGTIISAQIRYVEGSENSVLVGSFGSVSLRVELDGRYVAYPRLYIYSQRAWTVTLRAVKLELGSVSTLANDTAPNYAEELAKCQRFFELFQAISVNFGIKQGSTIFSSPLQFAEKRVAPSISFIKEGGHDAVVEQIKYLDYGTDFTAANHKKKSIVFSTTDTSIENMAMSFSIMLSADL